MITLREIQGRKALRRFIRFAIRLYEGTVAYVPPLIESEVDGLDPRINPSFDFCQAVFYMAYDEAGHEVGRIAGFINPLYNDKVGVRQCRFGFCDFIDNPEVSRALLDQVSAWGRQQGMTELAGPLGFTDMDWEGCLLEGYEEEGTLIDIYNHPYYPRHFEAYGLQPVARWTQLRMVVPPEVPDKHQRIAEMVRQRHGLRVLKYTRSETLVRDYGQQLFALLNEAYEPLYGVSPLSQRQIDYYIKLYLPQIRLDCMRLIVDPSGQLVCFGICAPSLGRALKKAKGSMWPFGWFHLAKAMYWKGGTDTAELLLIAVKPELQGKGVDALLFTELIPQFIHNGYRYVNTANMLDDNHKIQNHWSAFGARVTKRRAVYNINI